MSQRNNLTVGGGTAGTVTALQLANDLAGLTMFGFSCLDGSCGFDVDLAVVEAGTRVCAVLWGIVITIAGAAVGLGVAHLLERWGAPPPQEPTATV